MIQNENAGVRRIAGNFKIIAIVCLIPIVFQMRKNACKEITFDVKLTGYSAVALLFRYSIIQYCYELSNEILGILAAQEAAKLC